MFSERGTTLRKVYLPQERTERPSSSYQEPSNDTETSFYAVMDTDREVSVSGGSTNLGLVVNYTFL